MKSNYTTKKSNSFMTRLVWFVAMLLSLACANYALAQPAPRMGISPDRYQITFDERGGDTQSLLIQNLSNEPLTVTLSISNWELDSNNQIAVAPPTESSLDQWIVINPLRATIPPGAPQTIRWAVMPRLQPQPGEYRAIIFIEEELPEKAKQGTTDVRMKMRYGLPIYGHVGDTIEAAELHGVAINTLGNRLSLDLSNTGNIHSRLSGNYGIWPSDKFPGTEQALKVLRSLNPESPASDDFVTGNMPSAVILPANRRELPLAVNLEKPGRYTIQLNAEFAHLQITDALEFTRRDAVEPQADDPAAFRVAALDNTSRLVGSSD